MVQRCEVRPASVPRPSGVRADLAAAVTALALVGVAVAVGVFAQHRGVKILASAPPLFGAWLPHVGLGTPLAILVAVAVITRGPVLMQRLRWRPVLVLAYLAAVAWTLSLAMVDGWQRGVAGRLTTRDEYLHDVPGITDIGVALRGFAGRILDFQPQSWTTHVAGHPPGAVLVFVGLDRMGLGGGGWAAMACVLVGCLAAVAVPSTLRALGSESLARSVLPFTVLMPGAVWVGASADGLFAGVTACGIALLAGRRWWGWLAGGVLLGAGAFLSYGLVLLAPVALAVVVFTRGWRRLPVAVLGAAAVFGAFAAAGFWWFDGYHLVVVRYYQGIARERPYWYWVWANLACLVLAAGPAVVAGCRRLVRRPGWTPVALLVGATVLAVVVADVSGLSKAEVERIWLPFTVWLTAAAAMLPARSHRWWLAAQAATALAVNHLVLTNW